eukprot:2582347-Alexandrium_andersonii.AAC.1
MATPADRRDIERHWSLHGGKDMAHGESAPGFTGCRCDASRFAWAQLYGSRAAPLLGASRAHRCSRPQLVLGSPCGFFFGYNSHAGGVPLCRC